MRTPTDADLRLCPDNVQEYIERLTRENAELRDHAAKVQASLERANKYGASADAENADLRARLADAEKVIADYTATIREHMAAEKAAKATNGEPMAWAVFLPKGEMYDYAVFPHSEDAKQHAELLDADEEEGTEPRGVMPLYADVSGAIAAAEKARDEQAEAVRFMVPVVRAAKAIPSTAGAEAVARGMNYSGKRIENLIEALVTFDADCNPIAAAAVKEASNG